MTIAVYEAPQAQELYRTFDDMLRQVRSPQRALSKAGDDYLRTIQLRHDRQSYQLRSWQPLSPEYKKQKDKEYPGRKILERTGKMRRSYYYQVQGMVLSVGNKTDYHKYHEHYPENAARDTGKMPVRRTLTPTQYNVDRITAILAKEVLPRVNTQPVSRGFGRQQP